MRNLGQLYRNGLGVERDPQAAARWYYRAASMGFDRAQVNLATLYLRGEGVAQDFRTAGYWFEQAARQGHPVAQYNLGLIYERGLGVLRSEARALGWYNLAARNGHPQALARLSEMVRQAPAFPAPEEDFTTVPTPPPDAAAPTNVEPPDQGRALFGWLGRMLGISDTEPADTSVETRSGR